MCLRPGAAKTIGAAALELHLMEEARSWAGLSEEHSGVRGFSRRIDGCCESRTAMGQGIISQKKTDGFTMSGPRHRLPVPVQIFLVTTHFCYPALGISVQYDICDGTYATFPGLSTRRRSCSNQKKPRPSFRSSRRASTILESLLRTMPKFRALNTHPVVSSVWPLRLHEGADIPQPGLLAHELGNAFGLAISSAAPVIPSTLPDSFNRGFPSILRLFNNNRRRF